MHLRTLVQLIPEGGGNLFNNPILSDQAMPKTDYSSIEAGVMELDRNVDKYFVEVERAAFNPASVVTTIEDPNA